MTKPRLSTGDVLFDEFLQGGYEIDVISTIFGPSGSGKTNLCLISLVATIKAGKKVIFIDTEGGFSLSRLEQIAPDFRTFLDNILILKPTNFQEQKRAFEKLRQVVDDRVGLIIVDGVSMLYRLELGKTDDVYHVNRELGQQIGMLTFREIEGLSYEEIASVMSCPIGTVRSRIFRAREAVAENLRPLLETRKGNRW